MRRAETGRFVGLQRRPSAADRRRSALAKVERDPVDLAGLGVIPARGGHPPLLVVALDPARQRPAARVDGVEQGERLRGQPRCLAAGRPTETSPKAARSAGLP